MQDTYFFAFWGRGPPRPGMADLACFARLTVAGKSVGHSLASSADLPANVIDWLTEPTDYC